MLRSLYTILSPLVKNKFSGVVRIIHFSLRCGKIYINSGKIVRVTLDGLQDNKAPGVIFKWLIFMAQIEARSLDIPVRPQAVSNTKKMTAYLFKVEKTLQKIEQNIQGLDMVVRFDQSEFNGVQTFTSKELNLSLMIDGTRPLGQVLRTSGLPDLEVLIILSRFMDSALAKVVTPHHPMDDDRTHKWFSDLEEVLLDITGPVAAILIEEVLEGMGLTKANLSQSEFLQMFDFIRSKLEEDEQETLDDWMENYDG